VKALFACLMVLALVAAASPCRAAELGLKALEVRAGLASLEGNAGSTWMVSGGADLGKLTPVLGIDLGVDFWTKSWGESGIADWTWTNIGFLAHLRYDFMTEGSFRPYGYGGLGLHYWKASWDCGAWCDNWYGADLSTSGLELGFDIGAGAEFGSGEGMTPVARAGFNTNGGADYLYIEGGLRFPMGK
jgi:opacity protein-like surface antigen